MPAAPPHNASIRLSVSICRINRPRAAPSADRITISRSRTVARTNSRFATFTHANSSTIPASPRMNSATVPIAFCGSNPAFLPTHSANVPSSRSLSATGWSAAIRRATTASVALA